jgi:hypothetical protein
MSVELPLRGCNLLQHHALECTRAFKLVRLPSQGLLPATAAPCLPRGPLSRQGATESGPQSQARACVCIVTRRDPFACTDSDAC